MMAGMKYGKGILSWLINNHIQSETKLDQVLVRLFILHKRMMISRWNLLIQPLKTSLTGMITIGSMGCM